MKLNNRDKKKASDLNELNIKKKILIHHIFKKKNEIVYTPFYIYLIHIYI